MIFDDLINTTSILQPPQGITRVIMHSLSLLAIFSESDSYLLNLNLLMSYEADMKAGAICLLKTKHIFSTSKNILLTQIEIIENFKIFTLNGVNSPVFFQVE